MAQGWARDGYQLVEGNPRNGPLLQNVHSGMQAFTHQPALKMCALAARLRGHAAETSINHFRHKFEAVASELEEAAVDAESRARFKARLVS